jgi:hypothetical protein
MYKARYHVPFWAALYRVPNLLHTPDSLPCEQVSIAEGLCIVGDWWGVSPQ